jgi:hypothetical protein
MSKFSKKHILLDLGVFAALFIGVTLAYPGVALFTTAGLAIASVMLILMVQMMATQ